MAGGGGAAGLAPSIRHQPPGARTRSLTETYYIYTNIIPNYHWHCGLYPRNAGVNSVQSMQKIAGSRTVCTFLKRVRNGMYAYVRVCTCSYLYVLVCTWMKKVHAGMYWYILVCTGTYKYIPVHTSMNQYVLVHLST